MCDDLLKSDVAGGRLARAQAFDELVERTAQFYRGLWTSCSEDEKVVLGHVARHGLANSSVRSVVRQLLGRGLLQADPALRPMNETFRHFILTRECYKRVQELESEDGPSSWDRLRIPLGVAVLGVGILSVCNAEGAVQRDLRPRHRRGRLGARAHSDCRQAGWASDGRAGGQGVADHDRLFSHGTGGS